MTKGTVVMINPGNSIFAVKKEERNFALCRLLGEFTVAMDDEVFGNLDDLGVAVLENVTRRKSIKVYIQEIYSS